MENFFHPTDIRMFDAVVTHITIHGSAFCVMANNEKVFIPGRLADSLSVRVGDYVKVYAVGNSPDHSDSAKYRAIRAIIDKRLEDVAQPTITHQPYPVEPPAPKQPVIAAPKPEVVPEPIPAVTTGARPTQEELYTLVAEQLKQKRIWTAKSMFKAVLPDCEDHAEYMRTTNVLKTIHKRGECACARVMSKEAQTKASYTYYAGESGWFDELLGD